MITIADVLDAAKTALRADSAIAAWVTTNYTTTVKIYVGEDATNPPGQAEAPYIVLTPGTRGYDMGTGARAREPSIEVDFAVYDKTITTADSGYTVTHAGLLLADAFGNLIRDCLQTALGDDAFRACNYMLDDSLRFPLIEGGMTVILTKETGTNYEPGL